MRSELQGLLVAHAPLNPLTLRCMNCRDVFAALHFDPHPRRLSVTGRLMEIRY